MTVKSLIPAIAFNANCAEAIALYERVFGAKVEGIMRYSEMAKQGHPVDAAYGDKILHAMLSVGEGRLMVMDKHPGMPWSDQTNVQVAIELSDTPALERAFELLSPGGEVTLPPHDSFWGARFAMLRDAFGVRWMLSHTKGA